MVTYVSFWARVIIASRIILYRKLSLQVADLPCGRSLHSPPRHRRRRRRSASPRLSASRPPRRWVPLAWDSGRLRRPRAYLHSRSIAAAAGGRHGEPLSNKTSTIRRRRRRWCFNSAMQSCNIAMHDTTIKRLYSGVLRFVCCLTVYSKWASVDVRGYHETSTDQRIIVPNAYYDTRETIRDAILTYNQKLACLIYRTEPTINKWKTEKLKTKKRVCSEVSVNSPENPYSHSGRRKGRLWWEGFAEKKGLDDESGKSMKPMEEVPLKELGESELERLVSGWRREAGSWFQRRGKHGRNNLLFVEKMMWMD